MNFLYFIGAIASLILIHEIGHFLVARLVKVEVEEFGIGFPPRILRLFSHNNTDYTLNWLPFGGFVRMKGMESPDVERGFLAAKAWKRIAILIAGPLMNILTGILIYAIIFIRLGEPDFSKVIVVEVAEQSPAAEAQLRPGDMILAVNGQEIASMENLRDLIYQNLGEEVELAFLRNGQEIATGMVPRANPPEGQGAIGIIMDNPREPIGIGTAFRLSTSAVNEFFKMIVSVPRDMIRGRISTEESRLLGYKGMYDVFTNFREQDASLPEYVPSGINTLNFLGTITLSLALLNMLPLPALDGGRILLTLPELLFNKRVPVSWEYAINFIGFSLMIILLIYINIQDFVNPVVIP